MRTASTTRKIWAAQADAIEWYNKPENFVEDENGYPLLKDEVNICYLALDKHIQMVMAMVAFI
jgi:propionyl-CoA synthetase